jgi:hypothetical protein
MLLTLQAAHDFCRFKSSKKGFHMRLLITAAFLTFAGLSIAETQTTPTVVTAAQLDSRILERERDLANTGEQMKQLERYAGALNGSLMELRDLRKTLAAEDAVTTLPASTNTQGKKNGTNGTKK